MLYIDNKYVNMLGSQLRNFRQVKPGLWNFSCPVCGDSSKNKTKARGYVFTMKQDLAYKCHNCGFSSNFGNLLKRVDSNMYDEYVLERYKSGASKHTSHKNVDPNEMFKQDVQLPEIEWEDEALKNLTRVDRLSQDHPVYKYVEARSIPKEMFKCFYFAPRFKEFTNTVTPKFETPIKDDHPRLIIPFFDRHGKMFAFQGRAFGKEKPKYYTIRIDKDGLEKIYGMDRLDYSKRILVTEGPIDSLFLPNAVAVAGSSFDTEFVRGIKSNATLVVDNEPRSKEIVKLLDSYIKLGYNVVMFPDTVKEKDINEMILSGKTPEEVLDLINKNTFAGMEAELKFVNWRKI